MTSAWTRSSARHPGEIGGAAAQRLEPVGDGDGGLHPAALEIIGPAEAGGEALARETLELERGEVERGDMRDQLGSPPPR